MDYGGVVVETIDFDEYNLVKELAAIKTLVLFTAANALQTRNSLNISQII